MRNLLLMSFVMLLVGCSHFVPIKGNGRYAHLKSPYGTVFGQVETPSPEACILEARQFKNGAGFLSKIDAECSEKSFDHEMPWMVKQTNVFTGITTTYRFRTRSFCAQLASEASKQMSEEQKKIWAVSDCIVDPSCDYCTGKRVPDF